MYKDAAFFFFFFALTVLFLGRGVGVSAALRWLRPPPRCPRPFFVATPLTLARPPLKLRPLRTPRPLVVAPPPRGRGRAVARRGGAAAILVPLPQRGAGGAL